METERPPKDDSLDQVLCFLVGTRAYCLRKGSRDCFEHGKERFVELIVVNLVTSRILQFGCDLNQSRSRLSHSAVASFALVFPGD